MLFGSHCFSEIQKPLPLRYEIEIKWSGCHLPHWLGKHFVASLAVQIHTEAVCETTNLRQFKSYKKILFLIF